MDRRVRECLTALAEESIAPRHAVLAREILAPTPAPRKRLPGQSIAGKKREKAAEHREETARIREIVAERARWACELCDLRIGPAFAHLHHARGGSGRRRQEQSAANTILLCPDCHRWVHNCPADGRAAVNAKLAELNRIPTPTAAPGGQETNR